MRYFIVLFLLAFLNACSQDCSEDSFSDEAINLNDKGLKFHLMAQYDSAIVYYHQAIDTDPCYYLPHSNLAAVYNAKKDFDCALKQIEFALEKKNDLPEGWMLSGMLNSLKGNTENADSSYSNSIKMFKQSLNSTDSSKVNEINQYKFNLAVVYILSGNNTKGRELLEQLVQENPNSTQYKKAINYNQDDWFESILGVDKNKKGD